MGKWHRILNAALLGMCTESKPVFVVSFGAWTSNHQLFWRLLAYAALNHIQLLAFIRVSDVSSAASEKLDPNCLDMQKPCLATGGCLWCFWQIWRIRAMSCGPMRTIWRDSMADHIIQPNHQQKWWLIQRWINWWIHIWFPFLFMFYFVTLSYLIVNSPDWWFPPALRPDDLTGWPGAPRAEDGWSWMCWWEPL